MDHALLQQLINGLSLGLVYALIAIGFTLIFGVLNVVNFAHGEVYAIGAFAGVAVITAMAPPVWVVVVVAVGAGAVGGLLLERAAFRPFRRFRDEASSRSKLLREATLLSSLAVSIVLREALDLSFGGAMLPIEPGYLLQNPVAFGGLVVTDGALAILALSVLSLVGLQLLLKRTRLGLSIRAVSDNRLGAQFVGLNIDRVVAATFVLGSALGAFAGILVGLYDGSVFPHMGFSPGVKAFIAMVMGGLSNLPGAVLCALILGLSEAISTDLISSGWKDMASYVLLLFTLWFFPRGLFGRSPERA